MCEFCVCVCACVCICLCVCVCVCVCVCKEWGDLVLMGPPVALGPPPNPVAQATEDVSSIYSARMVLGLLVVFSTSCAVQLDGILHAADLDLCKRCEERYETAISLEIEAVPQSTVSNLRVFQVINNIGI